MPGADRLAQDACSEPIEQLVDEVDVALLVRSEGRDADKLGAAVWTKLDAAVRP